MTGVLLQISDPHFGTERPAVVEALARLVERQAPEVVVMSGDLTQRATARQFAAVRAFAARWEGVPTLVIPGNHDIPLFAIAERIFAPYARYLRAFGHDLEPVFSSPRWLIVCVNTTRPYRHKDGEVSSAQVERVARWLRKAAPEQLRVVVVHHPVAVVEATERHNLLHGREAALRDWAAAGADLVMGGHIHVPYVLSLAVGGSERKLWVVQAGTAVSTRVRRQTDNSVNLIRYSGAGLPRRCVVERWDYSASAQDFRCCRVDSVVCDAVTQPVEFGPV